MLCVLAFHPGDADQAKRSLEWIEELGGGLNHELLLAWSMNVSRAGTFPPLVEIARRAFRTVYEFPFFDEDERGHPASANHAWLSCARQIANPHPKVPPIPQPWLWLEPDAVLLTKTGFDKIEAEYKLRERPFMGDIIPENVARGVQRRPSGVGVYPWNVCYQEKALQLDERAWDDFLAENILPHHFQTPLIQDMYCMSRDPDVEPTFPFAGSLELISKEAVLFHRNSDGTLIDRLREQNRPPFMERAGQLKVSNVPMAMHFNPPSIEVVSCHTNAGTRWLKISRIDVKMAGDTIIRFEDGTEERVPCRKVCIVDLPLTEPKEKKKKRTALEQARINVRMAKARAAKLAK